MEKIKEFKDKQLAKLKDRDKDKLKEQELYYAQIKDTEELKSNLHLIIKQMDKPGAFRTKGGSTNNTPNNGKGIKRNGVTILGTKKSKGSGVILSPPLDPEEADKSRIEEYRFHDDKHDDAFGLEDYMKYQNEKNSPRQDTEAEID